MAEKVILKRSVAEVIETMKNNATNEFIVKTHANDNQKWSDENLNEISIDTLCKALYVGYDIEPEYMNFDDVLDSLREGKSATLHLSNGNKIMIGINGGMDWTGGYSWSQIINGKWTV